MLSRLTSKIGALAVRVWEHLDPKVRTPFLSALTATLIELLSTGGFDTVEIATTGTAVLMAAIGYVVPNLASVLRGEAEAEPQGDVAGL